MQTLVMTSKSNDQAMKPLILSFSMIIEDETSEKQCEAILDMIKIGGKRLGQQTEVSAQMHPDFRHDMPDPNTMHVGS
eukprot:3610497-Ditylum_brightwellii.AAC.1